MAFGQQDLLNSSFGNEYLRDYAHASKVFRTNGYQNAPRFKFLFHVYFNINTSEIPALSNIYGAGEKSTIGLLVKNIQLPQFQIETDTLNQYNRKRIIQKKINYQPLQIEMHDDGGDLIRTMWYNYFAYYYKDPSQKYGNSANTNGTNGVSASIPNGFSYNTRDIYANNRPVNDWGFIGESYSDSTNSVSGKPPFFRDISIYGFDQHKFVQYVLVNPLITTWNHDTYDYSQGDGVMQNQLTVAYETVKYYSGGIGAQRPDQNVVGFADPNAYDTRPSFLRTPGGQSSITGQGGQLNLNQGLIQDLQAGSVASPVGGTQQANSAYALKRVFGDAVPPTNADTGTTTTTRTIEIERLSGFVPGNLGLNTIEEKLNYLRQQQNGLSGQARPQPGVNSSGFNFPTPPADF
jgi:hypothetical protein